MNNLYLSFCALKWNIVFNIFYLKMIFMDQLKANFSI